MSADNPKRATELLAALEEYRLARERLLSVLGPKMSNRDPLAEFAEHFVAALMGGRLAVSPVQAYWDIELPDGAKVQVKYLINSADPGSKAWANEHLVRSLPNVEWYALVIIEGFKVSGVAAFPPALGPVCRALVLRPATFAPLPRLGKGAGNPVRGCHLRPDLSQRLSGAHHAHRRLAQ